MLKHNQKLKRRAEEVKLAQEVENADKKSRSKREKLADRLAIDSNLETPAAFQDQGEITSFLLFFCQFIYWIIIRVHSTSCFNPVPFQRLSAANSQVD